MTGLRERLAATGLSGRALDEVDAVARHWTAQQLLVVRDAHDWQCDCTPADPCRTAAALAATIAEASA